MKGEKYMGKKLISCLLCSCLLFCAPAVLSQTVFYSAAYAAEYDTDTIASVQNALNEAGYECGTADGVAGSKTQEAIRQYQEANGLTASGEIDDELLISLGLMTGSDEDVNEEANEETNANVNEGEEEPAAESSEDSSEAGGNLANESAQADSLLHLESDHGEYDLLGVYFEESDSEDVKLNLIMEYKNTSSEPNYASQYITVTLFQDGVSLEQAGYYMDFTLDTEWGEAVYPYDKEVQPQESVVYYSPFLLSSNSEIEIDITVHASSYEDSQSGSYTIECDESAASKLSAPEEIEFDAESDSLLHFEGDYGVYDLLGYEFEEYEIDSDHYDNYVYVFSRFENNASSAVSPYEGITSIIAYQDGVRLDSGYYYSGISETEWGKARSSDVKVKPGVSVVCYNAFELYNDSDIELSFSSYVLQGMELEQQEESYMIECDESLTSSFVDPASYDSLLNVENDQGVYDLVGCYSTTFGPDTDIIYVFGRYENTSDQNLSPSSSISIEAYQDGEQLENSNMHTSLYDTEWASARSSWNSLKPGADMIYYETFVLTDDSDADIEVKISNYEEEDNPLGSYTFKSGEW